MDYMNNTDVKVDGTPEVKADVKPEVKVDATDWRTNVPEEYREYLKDINDIPTLAKQYVERGKFLGQSIRIPGEDASPEARKEFVDKVKRHAPDLIYRPDTADEEGTKAFWEMAGVPREPTGYEVEVPEGVSKEWLDNLKPLAHKYGLTKKGFENFVKDELATQQANNEANAKAQQESLQAIQNEWGMATEGKIRQIHKFAKELGFPEDFIGALEGNQVKAEWLRAIDNVIKQFGGLKEGAEGPSQPAGDIPDTPQEIEMKIGEIESNPAFRNRNDPKHKLLVDKRMSLIKQLGASRKRK